MLWLDLARSQLGDVVTGQRSVAVEQGRARLGQDLRVLGCTKERLLQRGMPPRVRGELTRQEDVRTEVLRIHARGDLGTNAHRIHDLARARRGEVGKELRPKFGTSRRVGDVPR